MYVTRGPRDIPSEVPVEWGSGLSFPSCHRQLGTPQEREVGCWGIPEGMESRRETLVSWA